MLPFHELIFSGMKFDRTVWGKSKINVLSFVESETEDLRKAIVIDLVPAITSASERLKVDLLSVKYLIAWDVASSRFSSVKLLNALLSVSVKVVVSGRYEFELSTICSIDVEEVFFKRLAVKFDEDSEFEKVSKFIKKADSINALSKSAD